MQGVTRIIYSVAALSLLKFASDFLLTALSVVLSQLPTTEMGKDTYCTLLGRAPSQQEPPPARPAPQAAAASPQVSDAEATASGATAIHKTTCG